MELTELKQTIKGQEERIARLESIIQTLEKKTPPPVTPLPVDVYAMPKALNKLRNDIVRYLN